MLGWNGIMLSFMGSSWKMIRSKSLSKMFKMSFKDKKSCSNALSQAASKRIFPISFFFTKAKIPAQIGRRSAYKPVRGIYEYRVAVQ